MVVLLDETAGRQVVVGLVVAGVELQRLLVALDGFVELAQGEIGIPHVLQHRVLLLELEAVLQQENGFGRSPQQVQSRSFVIVDIDHELIGLS